jgi:L-aspartate oxidase
VHVVVATRSEAPQESNTYYAQGGIIYKGVKDSPAALAADILRAGAGHSYPPAANLLAEEGPAAVEDILLNRVGVQFDRTADGSLSLVREGGHTLPRILHVADHTGKA